MNMHILRRIPYWAVIALLIYMPFHVFLAQSLSLVTSGLETWKIGKDVFLAFAVLFVICLVWQQKLWDRTLTILAGVGAGYLAVHLLMWALNPDIYTRTAILGTVYNVRLFGYVILAYGAIQSLRKQKNQFAFSSVFGFCSILTIITGVASVVALLGLVQFLLPHDLLTHFGYGLDRGTRPAFFIDDNQSFPRIMSTLREPNALGAYLILPLTAILALLPRAHTSKKKAVLAGLGVLCAAALFLTFSRSAWLGAALAVALVIWWQHSTFFVRLLRRWWPAVLVVCAVLVLVGAAAYQSQFVRTYITHSTPEAVADLDSNDYHLLLVREGLQGIVDRPLGHGPGTAGIVSIQNPNGGQLTENYYVQIGYELGIVGLALFVAAQIWLYARLRRIGGNLMIVLLASFWGYVLMNMLLHTWSNEAVAAQWWLLAGVTIAGLGPGTAADADIR